MTMNQQAFSNPQTQSYTATQYAPTPTNFQHAQHSTMTPAPQPPPPPATNYNTQYTQQQYGPVRPSTRNVKVATFNQANTAINRPAQPTTQPVTKAPPNQHITPVTPPTQIKDQRTPRATGAPTSTQTTQDTTPQHVVPHSVAIPDKWNPTDECHDSSTNLGGPVYRVIQPTAWSRRRGLQSQDPLSVPMAARARYGVEPDRKVIAWSECRSWYGRWGLTQRTDPE